MKGAALVLWGALAVPAAADTAMDAAVALFEKGEGARVRVGGGTTTLAATGFACANCHGADGMGRQEGTTRMPPILWSHLLQPTSTRPAYDADSLIRAVIEGIGSDGDMLDLAMPRYDLPDKTAAALPGFLARLEVAQRAGIGPATLDLVAPADTGARAGFTAALAEHVAAGGIHGRTLRIVAATEPAIFDFRRPGDLLSGLRQSEIAALAAAAAGNGETAIAPVGSDRDEIAQPLALPLDPVDGVPLLIGPGAIPTGAKTIYARRDSLTAQTIAAMAGVGADLRLIVSDPFPEAADWARRHGADRAAAEGYALGQMATEAALAMGRDASRSRFATALDEVARRPVETKEFTLRK